MKRNLKLEVKGMQIKTILIVAMLCLAMAGTAVAPNPQPVEDECCWDPCGTKVTQSDIDATYTLMIDEFVQILYGDVNSNDEYDIGETIYVDMTHPAGAVGEMFVEEGDVRLSWNHDHAPNTKVTSTDSDRTDPLKELPNGQNVIGFVDTDNDGVFNLCNPVYVDTDGNSAVSVGDLRLTERDVNTQHHEPYTLVESSDWDIGGDLLDIAPPYNTVIATPFWYLVGYIDSDCSGDWTCVDKLYLQQMCGEFESKTNEFIQCPSVKDEFVTIGDIRLYIPPIAIAEEDWPECGTKVMQGDIDATYVLTKDPYMRIMFGDINSNGVLDVEQGEWETLYVDMTHPEGQFGPDNVEAGDIRLNWNHDHAPNTKVASNDSDRTDPLVELPNGQAVIGYTAEGYIYVDTDFSSDVTVGDKRLSERYAMSDVYEPYSTVEDGDFDALLNDDLFDLSSGLTNLETPAWELAGYIDSDCSTDWTCPDKLYLQFTTGTVADCLVTISDFRLYIPTEAIAEGWPECGTWVEQCDIDATYTLTKDEFVGIYYGDVNSNDEYDIGETIYVDMTHPAGAVGEMFVEEGDVRLSWNHQHAPNTKVLSNESDRTDPLKQLIGGQNVTGFVDTDNDGVFNLCNPVYVDTDGNGVVSAGDLRLTERIADSTVYDPYTLVEVGDWDTLGDTTLRDLATGNPTITTPFWELVGYIDSDLSFDWTCVDKLYLQQPTDTSFGDDVVTIGDLRLYIPPHEICEEGSNDECDYHAYDANQDGIITFGEVNTTIDAYRTGQTDFGTVNEIIDLYRTGGSYC
jgi:isopentenyl phosphate kinase